jgi:D-alanine-D-alanine ligase
MLERDGVPAVLGISEIRFDGVPLDEPRIVGYEAKWDPASPHYARTTPVLVRPGADPLEGVLSELALRCWRTFGLAGYARVDFRVDRQGKPWVLEVNANPCLAPDAGLANVAAGAGLDYPALVGLIASAASTRLPRAA